MATPFKMKGSPAKLGGIQGTAGHSSALKKVSPAKGKVWDAIKRAGESAYDKASQVGMGVKAFAKEALMDKEYHMGGGGYGKKDPAWEYTKAYQKEKEADESKRAKERELKGLGYVIPEIKKKSKK